MKFFALGLTGFFLTIVSYAIYELLKEHYFYVNSLTIFTYISILIVTGYLIFKFKKKILKV